MGISGVCDSDTGFMGSFDTPYTSRVSTFADVHNLDQCINYLNQSLVTLGFSSQLDLYSTEPALIARTCNCIYALIQQRQQDIEFRKTANDAKQRLLSDVSKLEMKVELLTDQLANKERELQVIKIKAPGAYEDNVLTSRFGQIQSQALRHEAEVGEKVKLEHKMRQWQESKPKTPSKILPPRSPMRPKSPAHDRLCQFSPSVKSVKRTLGADSTFLTPRSRFSGSNVSQVDVSGTIQRSNNKLKKTLDFEIRKSVDITEDSVTSTSEEKIVQCSGSICVPEDSIFLSPHIQYDNPIFQEESPPLSERLKSLEKNMRALSPIPINVEPLRSRQEFSPSKATNVSTMILEFENLRCTTPERQIALPDEGIQTPDSSISLAAPLDSGSLTPFQQFQNKNPDLQMTLVKQYLTVLNTATREELLQLKGIGPKRAADILELRQNCEEPFKDLQDLKSIGLSDRKAFSLFNSNIVQKVIFPSS
ncbi:hypothetical protein KC19_1G236200 [Ceratodon purpureus]|uniref:Uncharacterized protein n=1 Tax=Ceratodon purpureus TaxID=3225 RepID=A0A8T0J8J3_CERPU|nr:hypothetical protein KC19_1G236200 [Ceratodon purpureus]